jgi:hypothetical protein
MGDVCADEIRNHQSLPCARARPHRKMGCANSKAGDRFDTIMEISSWLQALRDGATELDLTGPTLLGGRVGAGTGSHANEEPC